jgi:hypothetical protein
MGGWQRVDPAKEAHLGHIHEKDGKRAHEKRCDYCRAYFTYDIKAIHLWGDNLKMGFNNWPEKVHCGSEHCQDYHHRVKLHEKRQAEAMARSTGNLFFDLKRQGLIA